MDSLEMMALLVRLIDTDIDSGGRFWADMAQQPLVIILSQGAGKFSHVITIAVGGSSPNAGINEFAVNVFQRVRKIRISISAQTVQLPTVRSRAGQDRRRPHGTGIERLLDALHRGMLGVFHLDPVRRWACAAEVASDQT
jgi:hypothetical protein